MYQGLALTPNHGQSAYSHDSSNFLHSSAGSPVYVPTTRVPSVLQTLPYLQGCEPHQSHLGNPPGWGQSGGEPAAFNAGSPHPPSGFSYSHSPQGSSPSGRDGAYQGPLLLGGGGREQYGNALVRSVNGSYSSPYPAYVTPEIPPSWTAGHFESSVLHSLQTRQAALPGRRSTFGRSLGASRGVGWEPSPSQSCTPYPIPIPHSIPIPHPIPTPHSIPSVCRCPAPG